MVRLTYKKETKMNTLTHDYLTFKKMIAPLILQGLFWLGVVICVLGGLASILQGQFLAGLGIILIGPLLVRVYVELFMVMFKINEAVQKMAKK